jgi:glycosyltransferase involved in cell wall biosynthesis
VRISIVTATLNAARFLPVCIRSVESQQRSGLDVEHVIVDGGSTDETVEIASRSNCLVLQGADRGVYDAINKGTRASTGDLIGCVGADDVLLPGALAAVSQWYESRRADWVVGGIRWMDADGRTLGDVGPPPAWMTPRIYASLGWNCIHHQGTYLHRRLFDRLGGFDPEFQCAGDYELFARALSLSPPDRIRRPLAGHRRHGNNLSIASPATAAEREIVRRRFAPASRLQQAACRQLLRFSLNAANPRWLLMKSVPSIGRFMDRRSDAVRETAA